MSLILLQGNIELPMEFNRQVAQRYERARHNDVTRVVLQQRPEFADHPEGALIVRVDKKRNLFGLRNVRGDPGGCI
jgi:hypothetical protein